MNRILILDDDRAVLNCFTVLLTQTGRYEVHALGDSTKAFTTLASGGFDLLLLDMDMPEVSGMEVLRHAREHHPGLVVVVITGVGEVETAVEAMKLGAHEYLCKPVDSSRLIACIDRALERSVLREKLRGLSEHGARTKEALSGFITQDKAVLRTLAKVEQIAQSDNNVLVSGESGTGKELVARAIHEVGRRAGKPFVAVNASAFASSLFDAHFFGHERGAFTGADSTKRGLFEVADGGTLFLDEIADIEPGVQAKLLRVLQSGEYFRLGSTEKRGADVRVIAATNKDLEVEIESGRFRRDVYYRLNISSVFLPPLRARGGDVPLLAYHFLDRYCRLNGKKIQALADPVMDLLRGYHFPGNVRELENVIAGAVVLETTDTIGLQSLPAYLRKAAHHAASASAETRRPLADVEADHIRSVLEFTHGNRTAAARILGISRMGLIAKLKRLGPAVEPARGDAGEPDPERRPLGPREGVRKADTVTCSEVAAFRLTAQFVGDRPRSARRRLPANHRSARTSPRVRVARALLMCARRGAGCRRAGAPGAAGPRRARSAYVEAFPQSSARGQRGARAEDRRLRVQLVHVHRRGPRRHEPPQDGAERADRPDAVQQPGEPALRAQGVRARRRRRHRERLPHRRLPLQHRQLLRAPALRDLPRPARVPRGGPEPDHVLVGVRVRGLEVAAGRERDGGAGEAARAVPRVPRAGEGGLVMNEMRELARKLLADGTVKVVIGYESVGTPGWPEEGPRGVRPSFVTDPAQVDRLVFDSRCVQNLAAYLNPRRTHLATLGKAAVVVKGCDARAVAGLVREGQVKRESVVLIGVRCGGVVRDPRSGPGLTEDDVSDRCQGCEDREPKLADHVLGPMPPAPPVTTRRADRLAAIDKMSQAERWEFWKETLSRCVRCYACREICPMCFCVQCVADKNRPQWIDNSPTPRGNVAWHMTRALHQAGRCADCLECERACPEGIPLGLLGRHVARSVERRFGYRVSADPAVPAPMGVYRSDDEEEFIL